MLLIASIVFVILGFWLLLEANNLAFWRVKSPIFIRGIGVTSILFFGLGIFVGIKRLIKSELSLIISSDGLNLNPKKSLIEFLKWSDITGLEEIKIQSTRIVIVKVTDVTQPVWLKRSAWL